MIKRLFIVTLLAFLAVDLSAQTVTAHRGGAFLGHENTLSCIEKGMAAGADRDKALYTAEETLFGEGGFPVAPVYYYTNMYCNKTIKNIGYTAMGYYFFQYAQPAA